MQNMSIPSVATRGVVLSTVKKVLVKFFFTNPAHLPVGLPRRRVSDKAALEIDKFNAALAAQQGHGELAEVGRRREGRVDTGNQTIDNLQLVHLGIIRRGLANNGFVLNATDVYFKDPTDDDRRKGKPGKWVVVLTFNKGGYYEEKVATPEEKAAHELFTSPAVVSALRELANTTWQWCHVWDNSVVQGTATVNVGGRLQGQKPKHAIAIREGDIVPVKLDAALTESEE